ncbi:MAG: ATP phosphoribosyltransferase regulatory subunit, partial [Myxococcota bacterium]
LNHRKVLEGLFLALGGEPSCFGSACVSIDKIDKIGASYVQEELVSKGVSTEAVRSLMMWLQRKAPALEMLGDLEPVLEGDQGKEGLAELRLLYHSFEAVGMDLGRIPLDISLVRGLDYYTGPIFETVVDELSIGSLSGGGRYDHLIRKFSGNDIPAVGGTLGLERIIDAMEMLDLLPDFPSQTQVLVTVLSEDELGPSLAFAGMLRNSGVCVETYLRGFDKMQKQIKYASQRNIPIIAILGSQEIESGSVQLRTGPKQQHNVLQAEAAKKVFALLQE